MLAELDALFDLNPSQARAIAAIYETLYGGLPNQGGISFIINANNSSNFGAGPGPVFNNENIYINIANSQVQGNQAAENAFSLISGGATLVEQVTSLYQALIPTASQSPEGLAFFTRTDGLSFYQQAAAERGVVGDNGPAIIAMGTMLSTLVSEGIGVGNAVGDLIAAVKNGTAVLPELGDVFTPIEVADGSGFDSDDNLTPSGPKPGENLDFTDGDDKVEISNIQIITDTSPDILGPATTQSADLIRLNELRTDPNFLGIDGSGYTVVVIDTGIDLNHPAFGPDTNGDGVSDRIVYSEDFTGDGDGTANDVQGHGSNVASIVGSSAAGYLGVAPGANIIALQALGNDGRGQSGWVEKALQWTVANAIAYNIAAVNLSLGNGSNINVEVGNPAGYADELVALQQLGVITVAAAGNDYFEHQTQGASDLAADPNVIAVGAVWDGDHGKVSFLSGAEDTTTGADRLTSFSQRSNNLPTNMAPGAFITGAAPGGGTEELAGTSQASPHVAGLAALAQQIANRDLGRRLTPEEFEQILFSSGVTVFDGDDENDNVINTNTNYSRVDALAMANAISALGSGLPPSIGDIPGDQSTTATLGVGQSLQSAVEVANDSDWIRVDLQAGNAYTFELLGLPSSAGTLSDPYLALHAANGVVLAADDDGGNGFESLIDGFTPMTTGTYFLDARAYGTNSGSYTLTMDLATLQATEIAGDSSSTARINVGETFASAIDFGGDSDWIGVQLSAGSTYFIDLFGAPSGRGTLDDPLLRVYDSVGNAIDIDDDGGDGLESSLTLTANFSGLHYLAAEAFGFSQTGTYELSITSGGGGDIPGAPSTGATISVGQPVNGVLDFLSDTDWYAFNSGAGGSVEISLVGSGAMPVSDPLVNLYDANGQFIAGDDDGGQGLNSLLTTSLAPGQTYFVEADAYADASIGGYTLNVASLSGNDTIPDNTSTNAILQPFQTTASSLEFEGDADWFNLFLFQGEQASISLVGDGSANELSDPFVYLYDENGVLLGSNDDGGSGLDSFLTHDATYTGDYYVEARSFGDFYTGNYLLDAFV